KPVAPARSISGAQKAIDYDVAAVGNGYVVGFVGWGETSALFLDPDASPGKLTVVEGPYHASTILEPHSNSVSVSSDGTDALIVWTINGSLKPAILDDRGNRKTGGAGPIALTTFSIGLLMVDVLWDGHNYVAGLFIGEADNRRAGSALMRIGRDGEINGQPAIDG